MTHVNARTQFYLDNPTFILSVARKNKVPESDIEDFCQQVLLESLQHRCRIDKKKTLEEYAELYVVMRISAYNRKKRMERHLDMTQFPARTPPAEKIVEGAELVKNLKIQIAENGYQITDRENEVLELLATGLSRKKVAGALKLSIRRINDISMQIRKKLKEK